MSSYINFFIRSDNRFLPLGDFSRSSEIYQRLDNNVPYEKLKALIVFLKPKLKHKKNVTV